ncbi:MAG: tetratricopeptide repeat protein [Desulfobulbaceae bacterium]|nr:tetratricopeptide repeat protein [Desulfobulbaceae bacterium]
MEKRSMEKNMMKAYMQNFTYCLALLLLTGCIQAADLGQTLKHQIQGSHYMMHGKYARGEETFRQAIRENPENAEANYYLGRFLLAENKETEALAYLQKAATINSSNADYNFWLGVAYGENNMPEDERKSYQKVLRLNRNHLQALIYLGHNQLKNREYEAALISYTRSLNLWPESPSALYNRALILKILDRTPEEKRAWLEYLSLYPSGSLARTATIHLNRLGEFSYRNHTLGARTVTLQEIAFEPFTSKLDSASYPSLKLVGAIASNMGQGTLQIVVYQKNNNNLARQRAVSIQDYLQKTFPDLKDRIGISWFAVPENFSVAGKQMSADESVRFFLTDWM